MATHAYRLTFRRIFCPQKGEENMRANTCSRHGLHYPMRKGDRVGRPFETELARLVETYKFALDFPVERLASRVLETLDQPIIAVGSGGSYTAASFLRALHQEASNVAGGAITPLQVQYLDPVQTDSVFWFLSARGKNKDILTAARAAELLEPHAMIGLCASTKTPLETFIESSPVGHGFSFKSPAGRDGYLATNSLLATCVVLERAYARARGIESKLPATIEDLLESTGVQPLDLIASYETTLRSVLERNVLLCLYGANAEVGAVDLESKVTEAALSYVQYADFRNFAHGRHHWLSRFGRETGVLSFVDSSNRALAERTAKQFPDWVAAASISIQHERPVSQIEAIVKGFFVTAALGRIRNIDPGRPGVAEFGSKLYHLSTPPRRKKLSALHAAVARKSSRTIERADQSLCRHRDAFAAKLREARIAVIALDLDGTMIDVKDRYGDEPPPDLVAELDRLSMHGIKFAIATGRVRGDRPRAFLKAAFAKRHWENVVVGYCNGSDIRALASDRAVATPVKLEGDVNRLARLISESLGALSERLLVSSNEFQVSVRPKEKDVSVRTLSLFRLATECVAEVGLAAKVVMSSHSIDIISSKSGKLRIEDVFSGENSANILKIGDMGLWPGNDCEFLSRGLGLSVDQVSGAPDSCWNLLPIGVRGVRGTIHYLRSLAPSGPGVVSWGDNDFQT